VSTQRTNDILAELRHSGPYMLPGDVPRRLTELCLTALSVTGVGLVWMTEDGPGAMLAATDGPAEALEDLQFSLGEGPCVDSSSTGRMVLEPDLALTAPDRWPRFTAGALDAGVRAIFTFPLQIGRVRVGVLEIYRDRAGPLDRGELAEAWAFADAATTVLLQRQAQGDAHEILPLLADAIENRTEVHQATGMVAVQAHVSLANGLMMLRAHAYAAQRPVVEVASDVVSGVVTFEPAQA